MCLLRSGLRLLPNAYACYNLIMNKTAMPSNPQVKSWTKSFIKKYRPALKELAKK